MSQYEGVSDDDFPDNFGYTHRSLYFLSMALREILTLSKARSSAEELSILQNMMFWKYKITLHYTFIMEYCKLLEQGKGAGNYSAFYKLNRKVLHFKGKNYDEKFAEVNARIDALVNSDFHKYVRNLRDKTYAHLDKTDSTGNSFHPPMFNDQQLKQAKLHYDEMVSIQNSCAGAFGAEYLITLDDDSTDYLLKSLGKYLKDYKKNNPHDWDVD